MQAKAVSRYVRVSSLKVLKVSSAVKGKPVGAALSILKFMPQKAAKTLEKALRSAVANADQKPDVDVDRLVVRNITADDGPGVETLGYQGPRKRHAHPEADLPHHRGVVGKVFGLTKED